MKIFCLFKLFVKKGAYRLYVIILFCLIIFIILYAFYIEPYRIEIKHIYIENLKLKRVLSDKIAVHLSDLHIAKFGKREKRILEILKDINPDLIFLTGDYVKWGGDYDEALSFLSKLNANMGVWAVMGDYDYSCPRKSCLFCHEEGGGELTKQHKVQFLRNEIKQIDLPEGFLYLGGSDLYGDFDYLSNNKISFIKNDGPAIFLSHTPLIFDQINEDSDVFILAGDTHGGQIRLPLFLWNIIGYEKCARYNHGLFKEGGKAMYVSRGLGTSHLPIRFLSFPELVVLHF